MRPHRYSETSRAADVGGAGSRRRRIRPLFLREIRAYVYYRQNTTSPYIKRIHFEPDRHENVDKVQERRPEEYNGFCERSLAVVAAPGWCTAATGAAQRMSLSFFSERFAVHTRLSVFFSFFFFSYLERQNPVKIIPTKIPWTTRYLFMVLYGLWLGLVGIVCSRYSRWKFCRNYLYKILPLLQILFKISLRALFFFSPQCCKSFTPAKNKSVYNIL